MVVLHNVQCITYIWDGVATLFACYIYVPVYKIKVLCIEVWKVYVYGYCWAEQRCHDL